MQDSFSSHGYGADISGHKVRADKSRVRSPCNLKGADSIANIGSFNACKE
jgi:hypothetical protein